MKKLSLKKQKQVKKPEAPSRITNETVAEHRERILAGGRRFKYPRQYARHRLVATTIIISVAAVILLGVVGWWQLYLAQNTNAFFYRVTKVLPLPVAFIDGEMVRYSDYLLDLNSSLHYLSQKERNNLSNEDGQRQVDYYKGESMTLAIKDAYAAKLARERSVTVSNQEIDQYIEKQRQARDGTVSTETYDAVILDYYGWSPSEFRHVTKNRLLRQKVAYAIDTKAKKASDEIASLLSQNGGNLEAIPTSGIDGSDKLTVESPGLVPLNNQDGGLSDAATALEVGKVSGVVKSTTGDGYYFIKLLEKTSTQINYSYVKIPLTEFDNQVKRLKSENKVSRLIDVDDTIGSQR